jgi:transglutaminase-like putative cysteine protease
MRYITLLLVCLLAPALAAQAPVISPKGDPSVRADTIYSLAVKAADYPDESFVYLLDDGVVRLEADGTGTRTYRQVVQILTQEAVETWAEQQFGFQPGHQRLTVNWIRVLKSDGTLVSDQPTVTQDADVPAQTDNPVYSDQRVRRVSLSGVAPGSLVDFSYTIEELKPFRPGDFTADWSVSTGRTVRRSRYLVDLPASVTPHLVETNLDFARQTREAHGRRTYLWARADVPMVKVEPYAADSNGVYMSVSLAAPTTWQAIGSWYAGLARDRYAVTPAVEAKLHQLVAGAHTLDDSLRAVHRWVAQDVRYVSVALGIGGYQPRTPQAVLETGFGDCKDKATIFIALAKRLGVTAYPVLLNAGATVDRRLPSISQFNHAIVAIHGATGNRYVDLTSALTPLGELPPVDQNEFALVVHPDGQSEEVTLPMAAPDANILETRIVGELSPAGLVDARVVERAAGARQYQLRDAFSSPFDSTERAQLTRAIAGGIFTGAVGDSLEIFDGRDLAAEPRVTLVLRGGQAARRAGSSTILTVPFASMAGFTALAADLEAREPRRFPIDVAAVIGPMVTRSELRLKLPAGWHAQLPAGVRVDGPIGSYTSTYRQEGQELVIERRTEGRRGVLPPDRVGALIEWMKAAARDDTQYIVLDGAQADK